MPQTNPGFHGFDREALALLPQLPSFDGVRYTQSRPLLASGLREPAVALIQSVASALDPALTVDRRGSVSPLHNDLRFAKADTPRYKDHLLLTAWQGDNKKIAPTLWIRIDASSAGFASGVNFSPQIRDRWREAVGDKRGAKLAKLLLDLEKKYKRHGFEVAGPELKRVPKPWDENHPRAALLRKNGFQVRLLQPLSKRVDKPSFAGWCAEHLSALLPVHRWLVQALDMEKNQ